MFEIAIGMIAGCVISLISIYLTINHKIKNEKSLQEALTKALKNIPGGDYKLEIKNGYNYASADIKLTRKEARSYGSK